jgi:hypothetical protein
VGSRWNRLRWVLEALLVIALAANKKNTESLRHCRIESFSGATNEREWNGMVKNVENVIRGR